MLPARSDWDRISVSDINDAGQIVGTASKDLDGDGRIDESDAIILRANPFPTEVPLARSLLSPVRIVEM